MSDGLLSHSCDVAFDWGCSGGWSNFGVLWFGLGFSLLLLRIENLFEMGVDLSKQFVDTLNDLGQFCLAHGFSGKLTWSLFITLDDFHVLFFLFSGSFQSSLHVFFLLKFLKSFNANDRLIGEPDFLASVGKQQRRISLILIVFWSVQCANHAHFRVPCQWVLKDSCKFRWPIRDELFWVILCQWRDHVAQCR